MEIQKQGQKSVNRHRALGCLIGSAVGDALGAPFEFLPARSYAKKYPIPVLGGSGEMVASNWWEAGEATDDTQMAIIEAETLVGSGLDYARMYEQFSVWAIDPLTKDVGTTTSSVLNRDIGYPGASREHFDQTGRAAANGCIMRAAPAALWLASNTEVDPDKASFELAAVTHGDPVAGWARMILNRMLMEGLFGGDPIDALPAALASLPGDMRDRFSESLDEDWTPIAGQNNSLALVCLAQAVWAVRGAASFEDALTRAINLGDDTDTVAAVAGGLAGAKWGVSAIPSRWAAYLHATVRLGEERVRYGLENLHVLAYRLLGGADRPFSEAEALGPTEIEAGVHAASMAGVTDAPDDWAIISLSRTVGRYDNRPYRRAFYLIDQPGVNDDIGNVVNDAVDAIDAFVAEGRNVVVHCHGGQSRTGFILRAWLMRRRINGPTPRQPSSCSRGGHTYVSGRANSPITWTMSGRRAWLVISDAQGWGRVFRANRVSHALSCGRGHEHRGDGGSLMSPLYGSRESYEWAQAHWPETNESGDPSLEMIVDVWDPDSAAWKPAWVKAEVRRSDRLVIGYQRSPFGNWAAADDDTGERVGQSEWEEFQERLEAERMSWEYVGLSIEVALRDSTQGLPFGYRNPATNSHLVTLEPEHCADQGLPAWNIRSHQHTGGCVVAIFTLERTVATDDPAMLLLVEYVRRFCGDVPADSPQVFSGMSESASAQDQSSVEVGRRRRGTPIYHLRRTLALVLRTVARHLVAWEMRRDLRRIMRYGE